MKTLMISVMLGVIATTAMAQEQNFVPWEMDQQKAQAIANTLGEIPLKYSLSLLQFFSQQEQLAVIADHNKRVRGQAEKEAKPAPEKKEEPKMTPRPPASAAPMLSHPPRTGEPPVTPATK